MAFRLLLFLFWLFRAGLCLSAMDSLCSLVLLVMVMVRFGLEVFFSAAKWKQIFGQGQNR
jgi:hypothetical protein